MAAAAAATVLAAGLTLQILHALPAAPVLYPPVVAGPQVTLSWSIVPGALGYRLAIGLGPAGPEIHSQTVGPVSSVTFTSPYVGAAYVRVQAIDATGVGPGSNILPLVVTTLEPVPAAPVNLQAILAGTSATLVWGPGAGGGAPLAVHIEAGTAPGAANLVSTYLPLSTHLPVPHLPPGTYFARVYAVNMSGRSLPSNEIRIDMTPGGGCAAPPPSALSATVSGQSVTFAWAPVGGVVGYRLEVATAPGSAPVVSQAFPPSTTVVTYPGAPAGTFYARVVTAAACGAQTASAQVPFTVAAPPPGTGPRTPNPPPGGRLPLPNMSAVVEAIARAYPGELRNSCGNHAWLFRLVQELRRYDTRWGLNWKRGVVNDMSEDIVNYNFSSDADEGTTNVYIIDVIGGHCGGNPGPAWIDQTDETRRQGTIGRWTLRPYIAAGGQP